MLSFAWKADHIRFQRVSLLNRALCFYCYSEQSQTWTFYVAARSRWTCPRYLFIYFPATVRLSKRQQHSKTLTFCAIVAFPSRQANSVTSGVTVEVAECVVPWAAEIRAFLAVVEFIAHNTIRKAQLALLSDMHVLGPVLADGESSFGGQTADHVVDVLWFK